MDRATRTTGKGRAAAAGALAAALAATLTTGCAGNAPRSPVSPTRATVASPAANPFGEEIVLQALAHIGTPYRYGGHTPRGFDCSGLVWWVHRELGIRVPRTAAEQFATAAHVDRSALAPGDLVFFSTSGHGVSHVGIYTGDGRFVHAPQSGRPVTVSALDEDYYREHMVGAGRFGPRASAGVADGS